MAWRFSRHIRIMPGVTLNLSKGVPSISVGPRGAKVTVGRHGIRATAGLPGTGLSMSHQAKFPSGTGSPNDQLRAFAAQTLVKGASVTDAARVLEYCAALGLRDADMDDGVRQLVAQLRADPLIAQVLADRAPLAGMRTTALETPEPTPQPVWPYVALAAIFLAVVWAIFAAR